MEGPFSIENDGTSDTAIKILCALIFDVNNSKRVEFKFYDMCACVLPGKTGQKQAPNLTL